MLKVFMLALVLAAGAVQAQSTPPSGKKEVAGRIVVLLKPAVEGLAQQLAQQPAAQIHQGAGAALQRLPAERREALARDIEADLRKYVEETVPLVRDRANKLAPGVITPALEERFTEDELRQVLGFLESPVNRKFQTFLVEVQRALGEKLVADARGDIEGKARVLEQTVAKRLGITAPAGAASGAKAPGAAPARK